MWESNLKQTGYAEFQLSLLRNSALFNPYQCIYITYLYNLHEKFFNKEDFIFDNTVYLNALFTKKQK